MRVRIELEMELEDWENLAFALGLTRGAMTLRENRELHERANKRIEAPGEPQPPPRSLFGRIQFR